MTTVSTRRLTQAGSFVDPGSARPAGRRNLTRVALGAVLVVGMSLAAAVLFVRVGHRQAVLAVARPVVAGHTIGRADLVEAHVSADPSLHPIPASALGKVVGRVAAVTLTPGALLTPAALSTELRIGPGEAVVGLSLKAGQLPGGLRVGDHVMVVHTTASRASSTSGTDSAVLAADATVRAVERAADSTGTTVVSLVVGAADAPGVAQAAAAGDVSVVLLGAG